MNKIPPRGKQVLPAMPAIPWLHFTPWVLLVAAVFWFGSLITLNLGIDQEFAIFKIDPRAWISQGRWAIFFLTKYLHSQAVVGYFPHLIFIIALSFSYVLLLDAFAIPIEKRWLALLSAGLFIAHPVWYFIAEFYSNLIPTALGIFSCSLALWLYAKQRWGLAQIALIAFAIGNYQAFILVMASMYLAYVLQNTRQLLKQGAITLLYLLCALALHELLLQLFYTLYDVAPSYVNNLLNIQAVSTDFFTVSQSLWDGGRYLYLGRAKLYASSLSFVGVVLVLGMGMLMYNAYQDKKVLLRLPLLLLLLATPLLLHLAAAGFWNMPLRAAIALPFVVWFLASYVVFFSGTKPVLKTGLIVLLCVANLQLLNTHSRYTSAKQLTLNYDRQIANQLFSHITTLIADYDLNGSYPLSVHGGLPYHSPYGGVATTAITGSFFSWDNGNALRISYYMRSLGLGGLEAVSPQQDAALQPIYQSMPLWPAQGAVRLEEGVILVKLGD